VGHPLDPTVTLTWARRGSHDFRPEIHRRERAASEETNREIVLEYVEAFNSGDTDALLGLWPTLTYPEVIGKT
jgi:hypothetical protein